MLTFLWYDNFGENCTPLHRNGMAVIPKICWIINNKDVWQEIVLIIFSPLPKSGIQGYY